VKAALLLIALFFAGLVASAVVGGLVGLLTRGGTT
jgi:hypothetical protein